MTSDDRFTRELRADQAAAAVEALYRAGEDLAGKAARLAPVEEGTLRGSVSVTVIVNGIRHDGAGGMAAATARARAAALAGRDLAIDVEVAANTIYAARQHEETSWEHPLGGQAKYLEQPFREMVPRVERLLELAIAAVTPDDRGGSSTASDDIPF